MLLALSISISHHNTHIDVLMLYNLGICSFQLHRKWINHNKMTINIICAIHISIIHFLYKLHVYFHIRQSYLIWMWLWVMETDETFTICLSNNKKYATPHPIYMLQFDLHGCDWRCYQLDKMMQRICTPHCGWLCLIKVFPFFGFVLSIDCKLRVKQTLIYLFFISKPIWVAEFPKTYIFWGQFSITAKDELGGYLRLKQQDAYI